MMCAAQSLEIFRRVNTRGSVGAAESTNQFFADARYECRLGLAGHHLFDSIVYEFDSFGGTGDVCPVWRHAVALSGTAEP